MAALASPSDQVAIAKIEALIQTIIACLQRQECIYIPLRCRSTARSGSQVGTEPKFINVTWPSKTANEARRFAVLLRILELMHEALIEGKIVSKRNIYYQDPELFKKQAVVDRDVDLLAYTFGLRRADLHVTAAAKGLFVGTISLTFSDGKSALQGEDGNVHLVPDSSFVRSAQPVKASWILVVEKEVSEYSGHTIAPADDSQSTFRTLVSHKMHQRDQAAQGIIITAKGYPDISTRSLLRHLSQPKYSSASPPTIQMLADYDPHGIAIMSTYKYGSQRLSHENYHLNASTIQWLGVKSSDIHSNILNSNEQDDQGLLRLSTNDRKKATKMLENNAAFAEGGAEWEWRREMQVMLMLGVKAEMEILDRNGAHIGLWVDERLRLFNITGKKLPDIGAEGPEDTHV